jgi:hypothetical protein
MLNGGNIGKQQQRDCGQEAHDWGSSGASGGLFDELGGEVQGFGSRNERDESISCIFAQNDVRINCQSGKFSANPIKGVCKSIPSKGFEKRFSGSGEIFVQKYVRTVPKKNIEKVGPENFSEFRKEGKCDGGQFFQGEKSKFKKCACSFQKYASSSRVGGSSFEEDDEDSSTGEENVFQGHLGWFNSGGDNQENSSRGGDFGQVRGSNVSSSQSSTYCESEGSANGFMEIVAEGMESTKSVRDLSSQPMPSRDLYREETLGGNGNTLETQGMFDRERSTFGQRRRAQGQGLPAWIFSTAAPRVVSGPNPGSADEDDDSSRGIDSEDGLSGEEEMDIPDGEGQDMAEPPSGGIGDGSGHLETDNALQITWNLGLLETVLSIPYVNVLKSIPPTLRLGVSQHIATIIDQIIAKPDDIKPYIMFFIFPRVVLNCMSYEAVRATSRRKRRLEQSKFTSNRFNEWLQGGGSRDALVHQFLQDFMDSSPSGTPDNSLKARVKRCENIARYKGQYGKAVKALSSHGIAASSAATTAGLKSKHPDGEPVIHRPYLQNSDIDLSGDDVVNQLKSFPKGTASGRSGWSVTFLLECCFPLDGNLNFRDKLANLVKLFGSGKAEPVFSTFLASAYLVPLLKKDKVSLRPIAVGEVLRRLISKCYLRAVLPECVAYLSPLQLGVGTRNGAEAILHAMNRLIADPTSSHGSVVGLVDFSNAFNVVNRNVMLDEVLERFPILFNWVQYSYGTNATLFSGSDIFYASAGVQQGDPLSPLLFALVLQPLLEKLRFQFNLHVAAYLDDVTIVGPPDMVKQGVCFLREHGVIRGLHISLQKTVIWSPQGESTLSGMFSDLNYDTGQGVELLGGALSSSPDFIRDVVNKRVEKTISSMKLLEEVKDPQLCLLLLRACEGMPKLNYAWRTTDPKHLLSCSKLMDQQLRKSLETVVGANGPNFGKFQTQLATMPASLGGLGLQLPSDVLKFAYLSSRLSSWKLQQRILQRNSIMPDALYHDSVTFSKLCYPGDPVKSSAFLNSILKPQNNIQLILAREFFERKQKLLLTHNYITSKSELIQSRFNMIISSSQQKLSYSWLFALPNEGLGQRITQPQFHVLMRLRLLMPLFGVEASCPIPKCKQVLDEYGYHALACHDGRFSRHQIVRNALHNIAFKAGYHPTSDAAVGCLGTKIRGVQQVLRPADLLIAGLDDYPRDCVDVTIVTPFKKDHKVNQGYQVQKAENDKYRKHETACHDSGYGFRAFALDTLGNIPSRSLALLTRLSSAVAFATGRDHSLVVNDVYRQIGCALQICVACQLLSHYPVQDDEDVD